MQEESLAHTKWECTYHIVFIPKYRRKVLYGEYRTEIRDIIKRLLEMYKLELVEGAVCADHIHISIRIPPKYVVSKVMGMLKGKSAMISSTGIQNGNVRQDVTKRFGHVDIMSVQSE